jgi:hypothetical protein
MTKVLRGVVRGKTIELTEELGMQEGQIVDLIVSPSPPAQPSPQGATKERQPKKSPGPPPCWYPGIGSPSAGALADSWTEEDDRILEQIRADRKAATWRDLAE